MYKYAAYLLVVAVISFTVLNAQNKVITKGNKTYLSNTIIIKLKPDHPGSLNKKTALSKTLERLNTRVSDIRQTFYSKSRELNNIYTVNYPDHIDPLVLASKLSSVEEVLWAEPRYLGKIEIVPNDPTYGMQNFLKKINAEQAWDVTTGDTTIIIGIIDTGVDWDHPDLAANMWINRDEIPTNSIDDDNNGYIDDYRGWDFGGNAGVEDNDPREDDPDHGTHVAGLASAVSNNGLGVASIGFQCKLMPVKVSSDSYRDAFNNPYVIYGYEGIIYAAENGAHIINCSWGSGGYSRLGEDVIGFAISVGALVVGAAGNDDFEDSHYPSGYDGVLSVASVNQNDIRSNFTNFGESIDVSAPGENITSTWQNDTYTNLSGTSMSSPLAAGLAGLVKSIFPSYTPLQISEQIRVNADPIDDQNSTYRRKLGFGRINAQKAVTNQNSKSVRAYNISFSDQTNGGNGNNIFESGELIEVTVKFRNVLNPTNAVQIKLENTSSYASIGNPDFSPGALNTSDSVAHVFQFTINSNVPTNYRLAFLLSYSDNNYSDYQWLSLTVNPTYYTQESGNIKLTITSKGTLGYNDYPENLQGEGFRYRNSNNLLFEGAFMIGTSADKLSDAARAANQEVQEDDFKVIQPFILSTPGISADQQGYAIFNDDNAGSAKLGIETHLSSYSYALIPYNDFIILRYDIININGSSLSNVYAGIFTDWDLTDGSDDKADYNTEYNFGYVLHNGMDSIPVVGTALISSDKYNFYAIRNSGEDTGFGIYDGFTDQEKWQAMSEGISKQSAGPDDISFVVAGGPFNIASNDTLDVAFALAAGDSLEALKDAILSSRTKYQNILTDVDQQDLITLEYKLDQNYPNPFNSSTRIKWSIAEAGHVSLTVYDILGNKVKDIVNGFRPAGIYSTSFNAGELASGVYIYKLQTQNFQFAKKMILIR